MPKNGMPFGKMRAKSVTPPERAGLPCCRSKFHALSKASGAPLSGSSTSQLMSMPAFCLKSLKSGSNWPAVALFMSVSNQMPSEAPFAICSTPVAVEA